MCTEEIEYREAYIYIPYKILITLDQAYRNPTLKEIIDKYPIFKKESNEYEQCILALLLLWEYQKGEDSFWWPYIDLLPEFDNFTWELDKTSYIK